MTGIAEKSIRAGRRAVGHAKTSFLMHARGIEHHSHGVENCLSTINIVLASGRIGRPNCGYGTVVGQGNGQGGREHGQKAEQLPGWRDIGNPEHRDYIAGVWGVQPEEIPQAGVDCYEMFRKIDAGEINGLLSICFNPKVSLPDNAFVTRALEKLEFFVVIDFFLSETAQHADVVLPGSLHEEDEGIVTQVEGRVIKINKAVDPPGEARQDWRIIGTSPRRSAGRTGFTSRARARSSTSCAWRRTGASRTTPASRTRRSRRRTASSGRARRRTIPGTPRLFEPGSWNPVARGRGPVLLPGRQGALRRRRLPAAGGGRRRRSIRSS